MFYFTEQSKLKKTEMAFKKMLKGIEANLTQNGLQVVEEHKGFKYWFDKFIEQFNYNEHFNCFYMFDKALFNARIEYFYKNTISDEVNESYYAKISKYNWTLAVSSFFDVLVKKYGITFEIDKCDFETNTFEYNGIQHQLPIETIRTYNKYRNEYELERMFGDWSFLGIDFDYIKNQNFEIRFMDSEKESRIILYPRNLPNTIASIDIIVTNPFDSINEIIKQEIESAKEQFKFCYVSRVNDRYFIQEIEPEFDSDTMVIGLVNPEEKTSKLYIQATEVTISPFSEYIKKGIL